MRRVRKKQISKKLFLIYLAAAIVGFFACSDESKIQDAKSFSQLKGSASVGNDLQSSNGRLIIKIFPENPTVLTDIHIVCSGEGKLAFQWQRNGQVINGENSSRLSKGLFVKGDTITATVTADGAEGTASIVIGNSPPKVVSVPFTPEYIHAGADIIVKPVGQDPDGDEIGFRYKWSINGAAVLEDSPVLPKGTFKRGDVVTLKVIPYDKDGEGEIFSSYAIVIPKSPPRFITDPPQTFSGNMYTYKPLVEDPTGDSITFSLATAPAGMTIDSKTGSITWPVSEKDAGSHVVEIVAQDPIGIKITQKYTLSIVVKEGEKP